MSTPSSQTSIFCHVGGFTATNGYAISTPEGWIGVDAPTDFAAWLADKKIRLSALLLTHAHFDHVMDAAIIAQEHQCPIYAWEISSPQSRLETYLFSVAGMQLAVEDYPVHQVLHNLTPRTLLICGQEIRFAHVPGHSLDSVIFHFPAQGRLFSGDTLMQGTLGRTDFPNGSTALLLRGIKREILSLCDSTKVLSGHGEPTTIDAERHWVISAS